MLVDPDGEAPLGDLDDRLRGGVPPWPTLIRDNKRHVAQTILNAEVRRIARELAREVDVAPDQDWRAEVEEVLIELLAAFPVYRSYLPDGRDDLTAAADAVRRDRPDLGAAVDRVLPLLEDRVRAPALRFQQTSGMVMAKGVEDRAFYRWSRLTSLNEVGADPDHFALAPDDFHAAMARRQEHTPAAMTTLSTHDTKRSEDVRARISVLAEDPAWWAETVDELARRRSRPGPWLRQPALAGGGRRLADLAGPAARLRREGHAGGGRPDVVDRT